MSATLLQRRQKMSLAQTYYLAHTARGKLSKEAARADHDLRLLVGHANLLDDLMLDLADAEREQELAFNQSVRAPARRVTWSDQLPAVEESSNDDEDMHHDADDEDVFAAGAMELDEEDTDADESDDDVEADDEFDASLALVRTRSRSSSVSAASPPELLLESASEDSESDDEHSPASPPAPAALDLSDAKSASAEESFYQDGFYLPQRQAVAAY